MALPFRSQDATHVSFHRPRVWQKDWKFWLDICSLHYWNIYYVFVVLIVKVRDAWTASPVIFKDSRVQTDLNFESGGFIFMIASWSPLPYTFSKGRKTKTPRCCMDTAVVGFDPSWHPFATFPAENVNHFMQMIWFNQGFNEIMTFHHPNFSHEKSSYREVSSQGPRWFPLGIGHYRPFQGHCFRVEKREG